MKLPLRLCLLLLILPVFHSAVAADFWRSEWMVPESAEGKKLIIRPIEASDADRFFHSYMTSQKWLYNRLGWAWPSEKSSLEQNETMVSYHLEQAKERTSFTYLVLDKEVDVTSGIHGHTHRKPNRPKKKYFTIHNLED